MRAGDWTTSQKATFCQNALQDVLLALEPCRVIMAFEDEDARNRFCAAYGRAGKVLLQSLAATKEELAASRKDTR